MSRRFKLGKNLPAVFARRLQDAGHDVATIVQQLMSGEHDNAVAEICRRESRCLFSFDTDFADIRRYPPRGYAGLMVLRLERQSLPHLLDLVPKLLLFLDVYDPNQQLWIVTEEQVRIRC